MAKMFCRIGNHRVDLGAVTAHHAVLVSKYLIGVERNMHGADAHLRRRYTARPLQHVKLAGRRTSRICRSPAWSLGYTTKPMDLRVYIGYSSGTFGLQKRDAWAANLSEHVP